MKSMTGYGRGSVARGGVDLTVEISSVNRRSLEVQISTPKDWDWVGAEALLTEKIRERAQRGKVYLQVRMAAFPEEELLGWNAGLVAEALRRLRAMAEANGMPFVPDAQLLFNLAHTLRQAGEGHDFSVLEEPLREAADAALAEWDAMRAREGEALRADLRGRLGRLRELAAGLDTHSSNTVAEYRDKMLERLRLAGLELDPGDERVLKEIALFADRCDVSEELTRLGSHFEQLEATLGETGSIGRKLDFILQEIHRELNTIGSKSNNLEISRRVIESKNEWERFREQVANVE